MWKRFHYCSSVAWYLWKSRFLRQRLRVLQLSTRVELQLALKRRGTVFLQKPKPMLQVSGNTLQRIEKFKYRGVLLRMTEGETRRLTHGFANCTQFCVSFIALWWQNGSFKLFTRARWSESHTSTGISNLWKHCYRYTHASFQTL